MAHSQLFVNLLNPRDETVEVNQRLKPYRLSRQLGPYAETLLDFHENKLYNPNPLCSHETSP